MKRTRTRYLTKAILSTYIPSYSAYTESRISFIRNKFLTISGMQRLIKNGCAETHGDKRTGIVIGKEKAIFQR
jgi:hypothetical protein